MQPYSTTPDARDTPEIRPRWHVRLHPYQLTCSSTSSVSTMHAPRTGHLPHTLASPAYIVGRRGDDHARTQNTLRHKPRAVPVRSACAAGACAAGQHSSAAHVDSGVASVASYKAPAGHERTADATFSTQLCGISVAATTSGTSSGLMRKRSCTVARQGGVILSRPGWMDARRDSAAPWRDSAAPWCMCCGHD